MPRKLLNNLFASVKLVTFVNSEAECTSSNEETWTQTPIPDVLDSVVIIYNTSRTMTSSVIPSSGMHSALNTARSTGAGSDSSECR